jgi:RND family efflux transporter MFP subunit
MPDVMMPTAPRAIAAARVPAVPGATATEQRPWLAHLLGGLVVVWAIGAAGLLARLILANVRFHRKLRRLSVPAGPRLAELLESCKREVRIRARLAAFETQAVEIPALFGVFRPKLLLPEGLPQSLTPQELRHVLRHELAHLRRRDVPLDWLATLLAVLHWLNPLVWVALRRMRSDRELACDETVLACTGGQDARGYGRTMLKLLEALSRPARLAGVVGIVEGETEMNRRVRMIADFKQGKRRWSMIGIALLLALGLVTLTNAQPGRQGAKASAGESATRPAAPKPKAPAPAASRPDPDAAASQKLTREIERLSFAEIDLKDVIQFLREYSGANFHVNWHALAAAGVEATTKVTVDVRKITVQRALELVLRDVSAGIEDGDARLAFRIDDGVVVVSTRSDLSPERAWVGGEVRPRAAAETQADKALRRKLAREVERLSFADIDFKDVIQFLREYTDVNIHVNWRALAAAGVEPTTRLTMDVRAVTAKRALELVLREVSGAASGDQLVYAVENGVLTISTRGDLAAWAPAASGRQWIAALTALPPGHTRSLAFTQAGRIAAISVREGDLVKAGQDLARLDDAAEREQLAQLSTEVRADEIRVRAAKAQLEARHADMKRLVALAKGAAASAEEADRARIDVKIAELSLELANSGLENAKHEYLRAEILLRRMRLVSPIDGKVERLFAQVGESANALAPVVRVVKVGNDPLWVDVPVPVPQALKVRKGQMALVQFEGKDAAARGKVVQVSSTADAENRMLHVRVEVPNPTGRPAGEFVSVAFPGILEPRPASPGATR